MSKTLKVYWWRYEFPDKLNFGDELTPLIIKKLWGYKSVWSPPDECEIASTGSILQILQRKSGNNKINVWGSGFIKPGPINDDQNLIFHAVRGRLTKDRVSGSPALGDPGLLMSVAFPELKDQAKAYKVGIVPHYVDYAQSRIQKLRDKSGYKLIDVLDEPYKVARDIASCEIIFSSSLHGLVVADSFNIPNYWMPLSDKLMGGDYKFRDYYSVYGESPKKVGIQALLGQKTDLARLINSFQKRRNIKQIQKSLISSFPY